MSVERRPTRRHETADEGLGGHLKDSASTASLATASGPSDEFLILLAEWCASRGDLLSVQKITALLVARGEYRVTS